ncbi:MAG: TusE/DsrC/DsvC family sulfur relay protein [Gammaproteobacteria bacterium]
MSYSKLEKDNEGYLLDPSDWDEDIALQIASQEKIDLTQNHWQIINFIRLYFEDYQSVPELRKTLSHLKETLGSESSTRKFVYNLFPYGYGQQACKIAGMRKPLKLMLDI